MGRGRGKGKKLTVSNEDDVVSGEDERVPVQKRRGRPQKHLKDDFDEEVIEEIEEEEEYDSGDTFKNVVSSKEIKNNKQGRKRKRNIKEKVEESVEEKIGVKGSKSDESIKSNGLRHNGSRRKSKPHRAAEAGVLCKQDYYA